MKLLVGFGKITLQRPYDPPDCAVDAGYWLFCLDVCMEVVGAGVLFACCIAWRGWLGKSTPGILLPALLGCCGKEDFASRPEIRKMFSHFLGFNARAYPSA